MKASAHRTATSPRTAATTTRRRSAVPRLSGSHSTRSRCSVLEINENSEVNSEREQPPLVMCLLRDRSPFGASVSSSSSTAMRFVVSPVLKFVCRLCFFSVSFLSWLRISSTVFADVESWRRRTQRNHAYDDDAFVFTVTADASLRQLKIKRSSAGIWCDPAWGPEFTGDLQIGRLPNQTLDEGTCRPYNYEPTDGGEYDRTTLSGSAAQWFALDDVEVHRVGDQ